MNTCGHCALAVRRANNEFWCGLNSDRGLRAGNTPACKDFEDILEAIVEEDWLEDSSDGPIPEERFEEVLDFFERIS